LEESAAIFWKVCWPAAQIRKISAGEQALSRRDHGDWIVGHGHWDIYDVSCAYDFLSPQSVSIWRHDLGHDVCVAWIGRGFSHCFGDRPRIFRDPAGKTRDYCFDDLWLYEPR